jgi:DNA-binding NarL/FixJ family response regulator
MNHAFSNLKAVSIWMTMDMVNYILLVDYREMKQLFSKYKNLKANDFIQNLIAEVQKLVRTSPFLGYKIHCNLGEQFICDSSHNDLSGGKIKIVDEIDPAEIQVNGDLYALLTKRQKQIMYLLADGYTQGNICKRLNLKLETYKFHRKNLYRKMNFYSKEDLVIWADKYLKLFYKQVV